MEVNMNEDPLKDAVNSRGNRRGMSPGSRQNLAKGQFKKGEVSNPRGRPRKELCITSILQEKLNQPCDKDPSVTWAEWLAKRALELAGENPAYYRELLDRCEGKVPQPVNAQIGTQDQVDVYFVIGEGYNSREESNKEEFNKLEGSQPQALPAPAEERVEPAKPGEETTAGIKRRRDERENPVYQF
jgi:hypothetical protein